MSDQLGEFFRMMQDLNSTFSNDEIRERFFGVDYSNTTSTTGFQSVHKVHSWGHFISTLVYSNKGELTGEGNIDPAYILSFYDRR